MLLIGIVVSLVRHDVLIARYDLHIGVCGQFIKEVCFNISCNAASDTWINQPFNQIELFPVQVVQVSACTLELL